MGDINADHCCPMQVCRSRSDPRLLVVSVLSTNKRLSKSALYLYKQPLNLDLPDDKLRSLSNCGQERVWTVMYRCKGKLIRVPALVNPAETIAPQFPERHAPPSLGGQTGSWDCRNCMQLSP